MNEFKRPDNDPDLEVELDLLPTDQGGRKYPLWQGCRLPHDFGLMDELNDGMYEFLGTPPAPGENGRAFIWLLVPERNEKRLYPGIKFNVWDGRFIGTGKIIRVINPKLMADAEQPL